MQMIHVQRCKHKGMLPNYCHAVGRAVLGDKELSSAGVHVILNPGRPLATTTLLQAKG